MVPLDKGHSLPKRKKPGGHNGGKETTLPLVLGIHWELGFQVGGNPQSLRKVFGFQGSSPGTFL